MAVKFDLVGARHKDAAEVDSYTPVMTVSHRFEPISIVLSILLSIFLASLKLSFKRYAKCI